MSSVPVFAPDGSLGDIPYERLHEAIAAGAKPAVTMKAPDGSTGLVPADKMQDAVKAGGTIVPMKEQEAQHPGFWSTLGEDLKAIFTPQGVSPYPGMDLEAKQNLAQQSVADAARRKEAGYSLPYRAAAPLAQSVGVPVSGMEQSARQGDVGGVLGHATAAAAPVVAGETIKGIGEAVIPKIRAKASAVAPELYQSALKPSTTFKPAKTARLIRAGLENEVPVSPGGLEKLGDLIENLNDEIKSVVESRPEATIDPNKAATRINQVKSRFANQVNAGQDVAAIERSRRQFLKEQGAVAEKPGIPAQPTGLLDEFGRPIMGKETPATPAQPAPPMPAAKAQQLKMGTYQQLKSKSYGEMKTAPTEAQKALAYGLKEEILTQFPELKTLNAQESKLLDLKPVLERAVQRISNHQIGGIGTPIAAGAAKAVTGSNLAAGVTGLIKAVIDNPNVKSRLAIALNRAGKKQGLTFPLALARVAGYSANLARGASADNSEPPADQSMQIQQ